MWHQVTALIGGCTVEELKDRMTWVEFKNWISHIEQETDRRTADQWQLAVVAYEVYLLRHTVAHLFAKSYKSPKLEIKDFLVKFTTGEPAPSQKATAKEREALAMAKSMKTGNGLIAALTAAATAKKEPNGRRTTGGKTDRRRD